MLELLLKCNKRWRLLKQVLRVQVLVVLMIVGTGFAEAMTSPQVAASSTHTLVLKTDGTVWAWGDNSDGELGDGTNEQRTSPVQVLINDVTAIAAGAYRSIALTSDGTVWTWGSYNNVPVQVGGVPDVIAVTAGWGHYAVLKRDGSVWSWGGQ